jgi:protease IV
MKKFLLGLVCGLAFAILAGFILVFAAARFGDRAPDVPNESVLHLNLDGEIPERPAVEVPLPFLEDSNSVTVIELWSALNRAAEDNRIKGILLEPRNVATGWAKLEEIRQGILKFKKTSGKPVYCRLHTPGTKEYYLATAADRIYLAPDDRIDVKGLRIESTYWKNTLDKIGVQVEIEHAGKYKDFGDTYSRTSMTPETREVLNGFLDQFYGDLVRVISEGRKLSPEDVRKLIDEGPFLARKAKESKLVDVVGYEDQISEDLKAATKLKEIKKTALRDYVRSRPGKGAPKSRVAYLVADGGIGGAANLDPEDGITAPAMIKLMKQIEKDDSISGVIFRVNSPGGDALASDLILHQAKILSKKKPMIISMADYAASGGYMISMTGDPVLSYGNTITGSIGVVFGKANLRGLYDKVGIQKEILTRGKFAAIDSEYTPMDAAGRAKLREGIMETYDSFLQAVAEGRRRNKAEIAPLAEGRAWTGSQAKQNALVDEIGGLDRAVEMIKAKAKIDAKDKVGLIVYPERKSFFEYWAASKSNSGSDTSVLIRYLKTAFPNEVTRTWVQTMLPGGMLRMAPYSIEVR